MFGNVRIKYCCLKLNWITHFLVETNSLKNNNKKLDFTNEYFIS